MKNTTLSDWIVAFIALIFITILFGSMLVDNKNLEQKNKALRIEQKVLKSENKLLKEKNENQYNLLKDILTPQEAQEQHKKMVEKMKGE